MSDLGGWKPIIPTAGDGDRGIAGNVAPALRLERRPCTNCRSFEKNDRLLARHFRAHGLTIAEDGTVTTPIAKNFPGRTSMKIHLKVFGWCRHQTMPVDEQATCPSWAPTSRMAAVIGGMTRA